MKKAYQGKRLYKVVNDGRTLRALSNKGFFKYPIDKGQAYIDELTNPREFNYKGRCYTIEYVDGCFFPFLLQITGHEFYYLTK